MSAIGMSVLQAGVGGYIKLEMKLSVMQARREVSWQEGRQARGEEKACSGSSNA